MTIMMKLTAVIASLLLDVCIANYSIFISESKLRVYFSSSSNARLVEGHHVDIVDMGMSLVEESGALILAEGPYPDVSEGSGSGHFLAPDPNLPPTLQILPPLPADVDKVEFTWFSSTTVNYTLNVTQQGNQFFDPSFNIPSAGIIPLSPSMFSVSMSCRPFAMVIGRILISVTTVVNNTEMVLNFFIEKSCNDTSGPSFTTILYMEPSITQEGLVSSHVLTSFHQTTHSFSAPLLLTSSTMYLSSITPSSSLVNVQLPPIYSVPRSMSLLLVTPGSSNSGIQSLSHLFFPHSTSISLRTSSSGLLSLTPTSVSLSLPMTPSFPPYSYSTQPLYSNNISTVSSYRVVSYSYLTSSLSPLIELVNSSNNFVLPTSISSQSTPSPSVLQSRTLLPSVLSSIFTVLPTISYVVTRSSSTFMETDDPIRSKIDSSLHPSSSVLLETTGGGSSSHLLLLVCVPIGGILLISIIVSSCIIFCIRLKSHSKKAMHAFSDDPLDVVHTVPYSISPMNDFTKKSLPPVSLWMSFSWGAVSTLTRSLQTLMFQMGVDRKSLSIGDVIARGEYGSVVSGQLNIVRTDVMSGSQSVTIKILTGTPEGSKRDEVIKFLEAATLMKGIQHDNILPVLRVSIEDNYVPLVIYPMVEHGDMFKIIKLASDPEQSILSPLTLALSIELAIQIATAMNHLAELSIIHPDLALRNCVYDSGNVVKVSDGALAQQLYPECYYTLFGATRPVRWAAVETLQEGLCTVKSNVWSYGVTVWEILTYAEMPYSEVNNNRSILSTIKMGARLTKPSNCPQKLYDILRACWCEKGEERPHFKTIIILLRQFLHQLSNEGSNEHKSLNLPQSRLSSSSIGKSVSREGLSYGDSPGRSRNRLMPMETSMSSLRRVSMASMMSRESTGEKLSVTFSVLSGDDRSGSESDDDKNNDLKLRSLTEQQELRTILHQVSTSFIEDSCREVQDTQPALLSREDKEVKDDDRSLLTLVPPSSVTSPRVIIEADEASLASSNPLSVTPPPNQSMDTQSKTSTIDLESVSTATYTSSPLHSVPFLYPTASASGSGVTSHTERSEQSPLTVHHRAYGSPSLAPLHSQPTGKSTDSGIRSDDDSEITISPSTSVTKRANKCNEHTTVNEFSNSLMAAFDSWDAS